MPRLTLRVLTVAAAALLAGYGCSAGETPTSSSAAAPLASYQKLRVPAATLAPRFAGSGDEVSSVSQVVDEKGGVLELGSGYRLVFPAGALTGRTRISMTADPEYVGVELEPHGLQFPRGRAPVLTLNYAGVDVSAFQRLSIVYVADSGAILEVLPSSVSRETKAVSTKLRHFSGYIISGT